MNEVILFILWFLLVYLVYYLVVISKKKKLNKLVKSTECVYLEKKYHIACTYEIINNDYVILN